MTNQFRCGIIYFVKSLGCSQAVRQWILTPPFRGFKSFHPNQMASIARWGLIFTEMWLSLVERRVRDAEVAGSNPVISTITLSPHILEEIQNARRNSFRRAFALLCCCGFWLCYAVLGYSADGLVFCQPFFYRLIFFVKRSPLWSRGAH